MRQGLITAALAGALLAAAPGSFAAQGTSGTSSESRARALGTVRLSQNVKANGELLRAGTYQVRLTEEVATPEAPGTQPSLSRWVEFLQGGQVRGREVASVIPAAEIGQIAKGRRVPAGSHRVEMLKGNEFVRVWINQAGTNYLIHMPPA